MKTITRTRRKQKHFGFTLIEAVLYSSLLSILAAGFIGLAVHVHLDDVSLMNDVNEAYIH